MYSVTGIFKGFRKGFHRFQDDFVQKNLFLVPTLDIYRVNLAPPTGSSRLQFLVKAVFLRETVFESHVCGGS